MTPAGLPELPGGLGHPTDVQRLTGGSICTVWRVRLADGGEAVVKETPYPAEIEADGLRALAEAGAPVPEVYAAGDHILVLEHVTGPADPEGLGRALADTHRRTAPQFGWHQDNLIGSLPQANRWTERWADFYVEQRIRPHLDAPALPARVRTRLAGACDGPLQEVLETDPPASLIHGDLWSGNIVAGRWLIDPAVCHADREHELAFMTLFGGIPDRVFAAYAEAWPLADGWQRRRPLLQLYHLLVHVRLFGSGYVGGVVARLDALGW